MPTTDLTSETGAHYWFGQWMDADALPQALQGLGAHVDATLPRPFPLQALLAIKPDTRSQHFQWFHFKASGLHVGQEHWFRLNNASKSSYNKAWDGYQAVASYDHVNWFRIPTIFEGDCLRFSLEATQTHAWFAYFEPYSRARHDQLIKNAQIGRAHV